MCSTSHLEHLRTKRKASQVVSRQRRVGGLLSHLEIQLIGIWRNSYVSRFHSVNVNILERDLELSGSEEKTADRRSSSANFSPCRVHTSFA